MTARLLGACGGGALLLLAIGCGGAHPARGGAIAASSPAASSSATTSARVERFGEGRYRLALHRMPVATYRAVPRTGLPPPAVGTHLRFAEIACEQAGAAPAVCQLASVDDHRRPEMRALVDRMHQCYALEAWQPSKADLAAVATWQAPGSVPSLAVVRRTHHVTSPATSESSELLKIPHPPRAEETTTTATTTLEVFVTREVETAPPFAPQQAELVFSEISRGRPLDAVLARSVVAAAGGRAEDWGRARQLLATADPSGEPAYVRILFYEDLAIAAVFSGDYVTARRALREVHALSPEFDRAGRDMDAELDPRMRSSIPSVHYANATVLEDIVGLAVTLRDPCRR